MSRDPLGLTRRECMLAALAALGGCGGVDSGGTGTGAAAPTLSVGAITGFGSVIVGGVAYDDSAAAIADDAGRAIARTDLRLGMRARVLASAITSSAGVSSATASAIEIGSSLVGPIEAIDRTANVITALGQRIAVAASTVFDDALAMGLAALAVGDVIEVHGGFDAAQSRIVASRIERRGTVSAYKLVGRVTALSLAARTLSIGAAVIDWSAVAPTDPAGAFAPGTSLRIALATAPSAGVWRATAVSAARPMLDDHDRVEIEGRITAFASIASFEIEGFVVDASAATFPDGTAGIVLGAKVEAKGTARNGVFVAQTVEVEDDDDAGGLELKGAIESVNAAAQTFILRGTTVEWNASTRFDSSSAADIVVGRRAEVRGALSADGTRVVATLIHIER